jgi:hypothetical protein
LENLKGTEHLGDLYVAARIILKLILNKCGMRMWTGFNWLRMWFNGGLL